MRALLLVALGGGLIWLGIGRLLGAGGLGTGLSAVVLFSAALFIQIGLLAGGRVRLPRATSSAFVGMAFVTTIWLSILRTHNPAYVGSAKVLLVAFWSLIATFAFVVTADGASRTIGGWRNITLAIVAAPGAFVCLNLLLWMCGVHPAAQLYVALAEGRMASWFGLHITRVVFPLARGVNNFGVVAGSGVAASLAGLFLIPRVGWSRVMFGGLACGSIVVAILCDSRASLIFGIGSVAIVFVARAVRQLQLVRWIVPLAPILPLVLLWVLAQVSDTWVAHLLSRRPGDIESATGRTLIWAAGAKELLQPKLMHLVGWGQYGQAASGVSAAWSNLFVTYEGSAELMTMHNMSLQLIFDVGYIGYAVVLGGIWFSIGRLARWNQRQDVANAALVTLLLYYVMIGTTEASISLSAPDNLLMVHLIMMALVARASMRQNDGATEWNADPNDGVRGQL